MSKYTDLPVTSKTFAISYPFDNNTLNTQSCDVYLDAVLFISYVYLVAILTYMLLQMYSMFLFFFLCAAFFDDCARKKFLNNCPALFWQFGARFIEI